jgi:hypothetical protein
MNTIPLTPPQGYEEDFDWDVYLKKTGAVAVPLNLFNCVDMVYMSDQMPLEQNSNNKLFNRRRPLTITALV